MPVPIRYGSNWVKKITRGSVKNRWLSEPFYSTTSLYYLIIVFKTYTMIYHSIPEYTQAKTNWENETAVVTPETINGLPVKQFYKANSKPRFEQPIYENPDGTKVATGLVAINKKRDTKIK